MATNYKNIPVTEDEYKKLYALKHLYRCDSWSELTRELRERSNKYSQKARDMEDDHK